MTGPVTAKGKLVFGCGCGAVTMAIRLWGAYPEGASFAILVMNAFAPLIDRFTRPVPFGRREALRGYVRHLMQTAHEEGTPLLRAMWYEFAEDAHCGDLKDQYMFGHRFLVAPVLEPGARERTVYLPAGRWRNVDTGEILQGGGTRTAAAPLDVIPVFERL